MKKTLFILVFLGVLLVSTMTVGAFEKTLKTNLFSLSNGILSVDYELKNSSNLSLIFGGELGGASGVAVLTGSGGLRYYVEPKMQGIFAEGRANLVSLFGGGSAFVLGAEAIAGYKYIFGNGFTAEAGAGIYLPLIATVTGGGSGFIGSVITQIRLGLGYSW